MSSFTQFTICLLLSIFGLLATVQVVADKTDEGAKPLTALQIIIYIGWFTALSASILGILLTH